MSLPGRHPNLKQLSQGQLNSWLDALAGNQVLIAPRLLAGVTLYHQVAGSSEITWGNSRPVLSVKEVFFPPCERLMVIKKNGQAVHLSESLPDNSQIVFGVRSCEARGVKLLDALFINTPPVDPYYSHRRENTILIGLACKELGPTCFCSSVGGAPDEAENVDVMLYEVQGGYVMEAVTDKGKSLTADLRLPDCDNDSHPKPVDSQPEFENPPLGTWLEHFNDEYWQKISERCISCRACAYVCPTCHCFAIRDEMTALAEFDRIRCWDSCAGENYRRVAGGHRARTEKGERLRNRFFCKFYYFSEQTGLGNTSACTGCGRCIDVCPVGVDITEVMRDLGRPV
jgi:sulfhydrogenase subunit beta (sulfur reductase)